MVRVCVLVVANVVYLVLVLVLHEKGVQSLMLMMLREGGWEGPRKESERGERERGNVNREKEEEV